MRDRRLSRRDFLKGSISATALFGMPAWVNGLDEQPTPDDLSFTSSMYPWEWMPPTDLGQTDPAVLVLNRLAFGPRAGDVERVRVMGVDNYIEEQMSPDRIDDSAMDEMLKRFTSLTMSVGELAGAFSDALIQQRLKRLVQNQGVVMDARSALQGFLGLFGPNMSASGGTTAPPQVNPSNLLIEIIQATVLRQVFSERQLFEVMVDFWSNHLNIYLLKNQCRFLKPIDDREVIRKNALGNFRELLQASAQSPAMLVYLDNFTNVKGVPNENYARELLELHTLSVNGGYTQTDVQEVARSFTGWSVSAPQRGLFGPDYESAGEFEFHANQHDDGEKHVLGVTLPAGGGMKDGEQVLDILARHPKTAQFISTKLARRFVADDPPASLVARGADAFLKSDGDIRAVMSAILHSDEFKQSFGQKVKRPLEYVASTLRALGAREATGSEALGASAIGKSKAQSGARSGGAVAQALQLMGQIPFMWEAPNGYPDVADAWINSNGLLARWNLALALTTNQAPGFQVDPLSPPGANAAGSPEAVVDFWIRRILHRNIPSPDRTKLVGYLGGDTSPNKIAGLVALILSSPDFQYR